MKAVCRDLSVCWGLLVLIVIASLIPDQARGEFYIGGYAGWNMPNKLQNIRLGDSDLAFQGGSTIGTVTGSRVSDLALENSLTYGAKVGFFFPGFKMFGLELDASTATPDFKQQNYTLTRDVNIPGLGTGTSTEQKTLASAKLRVSTVSVNLIFRIPGRFEPYVGGGLGYYRADFESSDPNVGKASDTAFGLNLMGGARYYLTKQLAAFGEYKYNAANFKFEDRARFEGDYSAHIVVGGLSVHFK